ncbi:YceD family protein [Methylomarinum vadi]|uniref:YceD family protein n=1 Tax=Methylomarinum vadi TaxID=438855 RepID=UPI0004DF9E48|nr:YceD family protein [Methylomarinum vadi]
MLDRLPDFIDPIALAERRRVLSGAIRQSEFARLSEVLADSQGDVRIELSFSKEGRLATIQGTIKTTLTLICQSCLQELSWPIDVAVKLGVVSSLEQADRLAAEYEPLLLKTEKVSLRELVEDEILLALPDFPKHEHNCKESGQEQVPMSADNKEQIRSDNPFSVLAKLKSTGD